MNNRALNRKIKEIVVVFLILVFVFAVLGIQSKSVVVYGESFSSTQVYSSSDTETIDFTNRAVDSNSTVSNVPLYYQTSDLDNACGATAGAIIIGFYDRYYQELIPNYSSYLEVIDRYLGNDSTYIPTLMQELYTLMRINVDAPGVSMSECMDGLNDYVSDKNRTFSYTNVKTSNGININSYIASIDANKPVILFNGSTDIYIITHGSNSDTLVKSTISNNHVYVGYGYSIIRYYNSNGNFRTDIYLIVACGFSTLTTGYLRVSSTATTVSNDWSLYGYSVSIS